MAAVSLTYDAEQLLARFARKHRIAYPLLSDTGSKVIRELGLLDEGQTPGTRFHGVPHAGIFLLDKDGMIRAKYAEKDYRKRPLLDDILDDIRKLL